MQIYDISYENTFVELYMIQYMSYMCSINDFQMSEKAQ